MAKSFSSKDYLGKVIEIKGKGNVFDGIISGTVLPNENDNIFVLKLKTGYNIAIKIENIDSITVLGNSEESPKKAKINNEIKFDKNLPNVCIISLGGTIASRVDYKTGGVSSQFTAEDLANAIPEIKEIANIECVSLMNKWSENLNKNDWIIIAKNLQNLLNNTNKEYDGFVITQGTDTIHYVSSALSFMLEEFGVPVIIVGAQRSSDRPSSDAAYNLLGALTFIKESKKSGVFVAMHNTADDKVIAIHLGTKVRKLHTSRRDAFRSVNISPVALVHLDLQAHSIAKSEIVFNNIYNDLQPIKKGKIIIQDKLGKEVALLKFYPSLSQDIFKYVLENNKIVILEGTGFCNISDDLIEIVKQLKNKTICFMTSQCIFGRVNMNVYTQGRIEQDAGIIGLEDMLSETAYTKACYVLGKTQKREEIIKLMTQNLKGEISERTEYGED